MPKKIRLWCTLLSVGSMALCCILATFIVLSLRKVNGITLSVDEDITSFVGRDNYTSSDMIVAAQEHAQETVGFWGSSRLSGLSATLDCSNQHCELQQITTRFTLSPHFNFFVLSSADEMLPSLQYIFRIPNNEVVAFRGPDSSFPRRASEYTSWEDINVSLDEIIQIASEIENMPNHIFIIWSYSWQVHISSNEGTTIYYVDYYSGVISQDDQ